MEWLHAFFVLLPMNKNILLAIILAITCLVSCNQKPKEKSKPKELPFVTQTKSNLKKWIDDNALNPEDFKVSRYKVIWATDSLCVINFRAIGENGFGGHVKKEFQYFNIKVDGILYEWCDDDRYENGVLDCVKEGMKYDMLLHEKDKTLMRLIKDKSKAGIIFTNAYVDVTTLGIGSVMKEGKILDMGNVQVADTVR